MGSCGTLIASILRETPSIPSLSECCLLLESAVLLDTLNLTYSFKTTPQDLEAVSWLEAHRRSPPSITQNGLFDTLSTAKFDPLFWESLSARNALALDYKTIPMQSLRVGWSAVLLPIGALQRKQGLKEEMDEIIRKERLDLMLVSSTVKEKVVRRELLMTCPEGCDEELKRKIEKVEQTLEMKYNCSRNAQNPHLLETTKEFSRKSLAKEIAQLLKYDCLFKHDWKLFLSYSSRCRSSFRRLRARQ